MFFRKKIKFCLPTRPITVMWRVALIKFHSTFFFWREYISDSLIVGSFIELGPGSRGHWSSTRSTTLWHCLNAMVSDREIKNLNSTLTRLLFLLYLIVQNFLAIAALQKEQTLQSLASIISTLKMHFLKASVYFFAKSWWYLSLKKIKYIVNPRFLEFFFIWQYVKLLNSRKKF